MGRRIEFLFDFGSPNAYLAYRALPPVLARTGAELTVVPCLLGGIFKATGNRAPSVAFAGVKGKMDYELLEIRRFATKHNLAKFRLNPHFPVNSLMLMRGLVAAQARGEGAAFIEMGLAGMWEDGLKLDDPEVLARTIAGAGLDAEALIEMSQRTETKQRLIEETERAVNRGAFGVPTFFVGEEMFFGKDRLGQVEEEVMRTAA
jgi:2-hydroxychromene-2-carboxylate isomerase